MKKYLLTLLVSTSLFGGNILAATYEPEPQIAAPIEAAPIEAAPAEAEMNGKFHVIPSTTNTDAESMLLDQYLNKISSDLNGVIKLNDNIGLTFKDCNEANAFYDSVNKSITFCNELLSGMAEKVVTKNKDANVFKGAIYFVLYHEVGHALIDNLDLSTTGKEEDVADQFAVWNMLTDYQRGAETDQSMLNAIRGAIDFFDDDSLITEAHLADEHSLNKQRLNNVVCWAYGSGIPQFSVVASNGMLPENRLQRCSSEYSRMNKAMSTLLTPYLKL